MGLVALFSTRSCTPCWADRPHKIADTDLSISIAGLEASPKETFSFFPASAGYSGSCFGDTAPVGTEKLSLYNSGIQYCTCQPCYKLCVGG